MYDQELADAIQLARAKDDVIEKQAAVIATLQQIVTVQNEQIEMLKKALA